MCIEKWLDRATAILPFATTAILLACFSSELGAIRAAEPLTIQLRTQRETEPASGRYHREIKAEQWLPSETAVIVCDMWDSHHCVNAVRRVGELSPRMNALLSKLREQGSTIIHAPSGCTGAYADTPARLRAQQVKPSPSVPGDIG